MDAKVKKFGEKTLLILIALYAVSGVVENFFAPSDKDFYSSLHDENNEYDLYLMASASFETKKEKLSRDFVSEIKDCLKKDPRKSVSLGEHKDDRNLYLSLISNDYKYDLAFTWRVVSSKAYIIGVERRTRLKDFKIINRGGFGAIGGSCFGELLSDMQL